MGKTVRHSTVDEIFGDPAFELEMDAHTGPMIPKAPVKNEFLSDAALVAVAGTPQKTRKLFGPAYFGPVPNPEEVAAANERHLVRMDETHELQRRV